LQSYQDSNVGNTWWAENLGVRSETVLCLLVRVMQVVKSAWLDDVQSSEAGQFGA